MAKEIASVAPIKPHLVAPMMIAVAMTTPIVMVDMLRRLPIVEIRQKMVIAQFLEIKPLNFVRVGKPKCLSSG